jgi:hypothetical protein
MNYIERAQMLAPVHEAGHAMGALEVGLEIVSVDIFPDSNFHCGNCRVFQ